MAIVWTCCVAKSKRLRLLLAVLFFVQLFILFIVIRSRNSTGDKQGFGHISRTSKRDTPVTIPASFTKSAAEQHNDKSTTNVTFNEPTKKPLSIDNSENSTPKPTLTTAMVNQPAKTANDQKSTPKPTVAVVVTKKPTEKPVIDMVNDYQPYIDFKFVFPEIMPAIEGPRDFFLIVLVNSGAKGDEFRQRRDNIRQTWASSKTCEHLKAMNNPKLKNLKWILVFVLGKAGPGTDDDKRNAEEAKEYNDMLIGNIDDNYLNNIIKFYMGQLWAATFSAKYTLKTDDDVYVRIPGVLEYLAKEGFPSRFYGGETYPNSKVERWIGGKWSISEKYFADAEWPPFNAGAFIILSTDLHNSLFNYVHVRKPFHTDDAYVGVAMRDFKVTVTHILSFEVNDNMARLLRFKTNCGILARIAYGHSVDPISSKLLHDQIEWMCRKHITAKTCSN